MSGVWDGKQCPECGQGTLHDQQRRVRTDYRGHLFEGTHAAAVCDFCGDGIEYHDEAAETALTEFRSRIDKAERDELSGARRRLNLSQVQASKLTGGGHNAFSRYERGEAKPIMAVINLFRLLDRYPVLLSELSTEFALPKSKGLTRTVFSLPISSSDGLAGKAGKVVTTTFMVESPKAPIPFLFAHSHQVISSYIYVVFESSRDEPRFSWTPTHGDQQYASA